MAGEHLKQLRRGARAADINVRLERARRRDEAFVVSVRTELGAGESENLHIRNPADSDLTIEIQPLVLPTQFRGRYTIYDQLGDSVSGGTTLTPDSLLLDEQSEQPKESVAVAHQGVSFDDTSPPHWEGTIPSGGQGAGTQGGTGTGTEPDLEPGREIVISVTNDSTSTRYATIGLVYIEEDTVWSRRF